MSKHDPSAQTVNREEANSAFDKAFKEVCRDQNKKVDPNSEWGKNKRQNIHIALQDEPDKDTLYQEYSKKLVPRVRQLWDETY